MDNVTVVDAYGATVVAAGETGEPPAEAVNVWTSSLPLVNVTGTSVPFAPQVGDWKMALLPPGAMGSADAADAQVTAMTPRPAAPARARAKEKGRASIGSDLRKTSSGVAPVDSSTNRAEQQDDRSSIARLGSTNQMKLESNQMLASCVFPRERSKTERPVTSAPQRTWGRTLAVAGSVGSWGLDRPRTGERALGLIDLAP
ncbi:MULTISPECIES: hypothetical protein [Dermacoccus]|uniref:Uncharacterized protein n=2 Tax=Dermacoccus TaxID=57495 RepID=A0A417Z5X2_9MICO|nr:hypothetical protein [Dermacoccus abyssi]RHW45762.1 hypothetical protein D1832_08680 [Dermacoccus abyssi]